MTSFIQLLGHVDTLAEFGLLVLLLVVGPIRKFLFFSVYVIAACLADLIQTVAYYRLGWLSKAYYTIYWTNHIILDLLLFVVVISLTYEALRDKPLRSKAAKVFGAIVVAALIVPFTLLHEHQNKYGFFTGHWFNHVSQIWSFGAALMNLALWTALLTDRRRDPHLVTLSIGVGILTSADAIAWGVRQWLPQNNRWPIDAIWVITHITALLIWCRAFRPSVRRVSAAPARALTNPS